MRFQLTVTQSFGKSILVISSCGATIAMSKELIDLASDMVVWNQRIITDAVCKLARGDHTATWDNTEFDTNQPASARKSHQ